MPYPIGYVTFAPILIPLGRFGRLLKTSTKLREMEPKSSLFLSTLISNFFNEKPLLPQIYELQVILNKLKFLKIELTEAFQVSAIVAKLPPSWKGYRKRILHKRGNYLLEEIKKYLQIEEESRSRDKVVEESNGRTNKANMVSNPNHFKGKNNKKKKTFWEFYCPQQK